MTDAALPNLSEEKMQQLLAAVGVESVKDAKQNVEAFEHDWRQPRYFSRIQLNELKYFSANVALRATAKFTQFFQKTFEVATDSTSQHFANEFIGRSSDKDNFDHYLVFGTRATQAPGAQSNTAGELQPWGLVGVPHTTALYWTTQSLGEEKSEGDVTRGLSELEESLLLDTALFFVEALADSYENQEFHSAGAIVAGQFPLDLESTKDLSKITFNTKQADSDEDEKAYILMLSDKLEPITKMVTQTTETISTEDISKALVGHLGQMNVTVAARLGSMDLSFGELMNLSINDTLILDKKVTEPIELIVEDFEFFKGQLAKKTGDYAVTITRTSLGEIT